MALVCPDIVIPNLDGFQGNSEPSRFRCSISFFLTFSLVFSFFLRYKWILWIAGIPRPPLFRIRDNRCKQCPEGTTCLSGRTLRPHNAENIPRIFCGGASRPLRSRTLIQKQSMKQTNAHALFSFHLYSRPCRESSQRWTCESIIRASRHALKYTHGIDFSSQRQAP